MKFYSLLHIHQSYRGGNTCPVFVCPGPAGPFLSLGVSDFQPMKALQGTAAQWGIAGTAWPDDQSVPLDELICPFQCPLYLGCRRSSLTIPRPPHILQLSAQSISWDPGAQQDPRCVFGDALRPERHETSLNTFLFPFRCQVTWGHIGALHDSGMIDACPLIWGITGMSKMGNASRDSTGPDQRPCRDECHGHPFLSL